MSTALNDTINFQRRLRALSALFLYRLTSLAVSVGYFQRRKLVIVYWHFLRLKQRFQKRKRSTLIFSSFKNRNKLRFDGSFLFIYLFITLHNRVSVWPKIKNNEYISISGKWKLNEIGTKIFFFFFNVYTPRDSRFRGGEFLLKYVQTVSYFTLKKGRTLWKNVSTEMRNFRDTFIRSLPV